MKMNKKMMFVIYDSKSERYSEIILSRSVGEIQRQFIDDANNKEHPFCKHPEDYTLMLLGTFDDMTAQIQLENVPVSICRASDCQKIKIA